MARLKTIDGNLQILPRAEFPNLNPITESKNIPATNTEFEQYFAQSSSSPRETIKLHAKIHTKFRINEIKNHRPIFDHLVRNKIWMKYNQIESTDITAVAWIYGQHPDAISRSELAAKMTSMLPSGFSAFQLTARQVTLSRMSTTKTRAWVLEMSKDDAKTHFGEIVKTFHLKAEVKIVPLMDPSTWDAKGIAETLYMAQNKMLRDNVIIKVDGLRGLDEDHLDDLQDATRSVRDFLMAYKTPEGKLVFEGISQFNSKRVCFLTTSENEGAAKAAVDNFLGSVLTMMPPDLARRHVFPNRRPIRVGKRELPAEIEIYVNNLPRQMAVDLTDDNTVNTLSTPPPKRGKSYVDVARSTLSTQDSTMSSPTAVASQMSAFDTKLKEIEERMKRTQGIMANYQKQIQEHQSANETKFQSMLSLIQQANTNQETLQATMFQQQTELSRMNDLLQQLVQQQTGETPSPTRKKRASRASRPPEGDGFTPIRRGGKPAKIANLSQLRELDEDDEEDDDDEDYSDNDGGGGRGGRANRQ